MGVLLSRRSVARAMGALGAGALVGGRGTLPVAALAQRGDAVSQGIGLSRVEFEAIYGPASPGQSYGVYTDPFTGAEMHAGFAEDDTLEYLWMDFAGLAAPMGIIGGDADQLVANLLPTDARLRESFISQETPGSIAQLLASRFTSRWLGLRNGNRRSVLVTMIQVPDGGTQVTMRMSLVVQSRYG